jgi:AbrB family looped-hinge helix DNA binding protein
MASSRITSKGQITVPKAIRETLGVEPGDRIAFRVQEDGRVVVEPETVDLRSLRGVLKPRRRGVSVEDMAAAVRNQAAKRSRS